MPYKALQDLPEGVRSNLPAHGQEIYQSAFNNAFEEYGHNEERAHRVAWAAVKHSYRKDAASGRWKKR